MAATTSPFSSMKSTPIPASELKKAVSEVARSEKESCPVARELRWLLQITGFFPLHTPHDHSHVVGPTSIQCIMDESIADLF